MDLDCLLLPCKLHRKLTTIRNLNILPYLLSKQQNIMDIVATSVFTLVYPLSHSSLSLSFLHWIVLSPSLPPFSLCFFTLPPALNFPFCCLFHFLQMLINPFSFWSSLSLLISLPLFPSFHHYLFQDFCFCLCKHLSICIS